MYGFQKVVQFYHLIWRTSPQTPSLCDRVQPDGRATEQRSGEQGGLLSSKHCLPASRRAERPTVLRGNKTEKGWMRSNVSKLSQKTLYPNAFLLGLQHILDVWNELKQTFLSFYPISFCIFHFSGCSFSLLACLEGSENVFTLSQVSSAFAILVTFKMVQNH